MSHDEALRLLSQPRELAGHLRKIAETIRKDALDKPLEEIPYMRGLAHGLESAAEEILRLVELSKPQQPDSEVTVYEELPVAAVLNLLETRRGVDQG